jgi:DNA-directed RNA polymerase specialized sigma24 family protein
VLGVPEGTVASRLYHARRALRAALEEMGVQYP